MRGDGKGAALALDQRRAVEKSGDTRAVERRGHDEDAQVGAQRALCVERQSQTEIRVKRALMELVEQHRRDAFQLRIVEDHPRENAFGDDFDAGAGGDFGLHPHPHADRAADLLAERLRHAGGGRARGEAARFEHDDPAPCGPRLVHQRQRHARRLARARRGDEHGGVCVAQGRFQRLKDSVDGEGRRHHSPTCQPDARSASISSRAYRRCGRDPRISRETRGLVIGRAHRGHSQSAFPG